MSRKKSVFLGSIAFLIIGASTAIGATIVKGKPNEPKKDEKAQATMRLPVSLVGSNSLYQLSDASKSWAGEIVSPSLLEVHPQGEGSIVQLYVRVGQKVSRGEGIARLSPPPASLERASMAAEKKEALIRARANAEATEKVVNKSREQFLEARKSLLPARDAALELAQKDIERNLYTDKSSEVELEKMRAEKDASLGFAVKERDKARVDASLKDRELRTLVEQTVEKDLYAFTYWWGSQARSLLKSWTVQLRPGVGGTDSSAKNEYELALGRVLRDLDSSTETLEESSLAYAASAKKLAYASSGGVVASSMVEMWKKDTREQQMDIVSAVNERRESEAMADVKDAEVAKMTADRDKEITTSSISVRTSQINSESNEISKRKSRIDGELEYQNRKREIDIRLSELDRELELSRKDVVAAEQSYATFLSELSTQVIRAERSGIVSGLFKKTGDYVMPQDIIASVSQENKDDSFVRFRVPSDSPRPEIGGEVTVIRPGFPFDRKMAIVSGVGGSVGSQGFFIAEAEFVESVDWPANALVRVMPSAKDDAVFIPFTAITRSQDGASSIVVLSPEGSATLRPVKTGKAVGDSVEVIEGLEVGEKYLSRKIAKDILEKLLSEGTKGVEGMVIQESAPQAGEKSEGHADEMGHE